MLGTLLRGCLQEEGVCRRYSAMRAQKIQDTLAPLEEKLIHVRESPGIQGYAAGDSFISPFSLLSILIIVLGNF